MKTYQRIGKKSLFFSSEIHTKNINARHGDNAEYLNVEPHVQKVTARFKRLTVLMLKGSKGKDSDTCGNIPTFTGTG
jgi:hypothetical protein